MVFLFRRSNGYLVSPEGKEEILLIQSLYTPLLTLSHCVSL